MFKIYGTPVKKEILLRLIPNGDRVDLVVVNNEGVTVSGGIVMTFFSNGTFSRTPFVTTIGGIQTEHNRIKERT